MQKFTGWEYMLINLANTFGLDKELFDVRIKWAEDNLHQLESLVDQADEPALYQKCVMDIRKVQAGEPTAHLVELDACCSGIQIMSALTGCVAGANATGLVDPNVRADAYTACTKIMEGILGGQMHVSRADSKLALMTSFYGSRQEPINIFGADTPELNAFYQAANILAPGPWELLQDLLASWQPHALEHCWKLPDGFDVRVKVMEKVSSRIEVDELDHATFTYEYKVNQTKKHGLSNAANVVHSVDAYVLRCIHRRCNYDKGMLYDAACLIQWEQGNRIMRTIPVGIPEAKHQAKVDYYIEQYRRSGMADVVILPWLEQASVRSLDSKHLDALASIVTSMQAHNPFPVVTIHDAFKCHPNNMNHLRQHYINVFAELADSNLLSDILSQIHGRQGTFPKLSTTLSTLIKGSNYALS